MGLGDVVHDGMFDILRELFKYDYAIDKKEEIIDMVAHMIHTIHKLDGFCNDRLIYPEKRGNPCEHKYEMFLHTAMEFVEEVYDESIDDSDSD